MQTSTLFGPADPPEAPPVARHAGPFAAVALEQGIDHSLDYAIPRGLVTQLKVGQRVRVIPNHACVVANLYDELVVFGDGQEPERRPVDARGKSS